MDVGILEAEDCSHNVVVANNINYAVEDGIRMNGADGVVADNLVNLPEPYLSSDKPPYPDFTMERLEAFLAGLYAR
jgi:hypothetical protein